MAPPSDEPVEIQVAGESIGFGPFETRNAAALFPPDREPITPEEMEAHFRLMDHSRADLLALVQDLPDDLLDWQPHPQSFTIRKILRHVGNAEEWYVSRLVPPETLPPEWDHDEGLPIFDFLAMERRTAVARLRQLGEEERAGIFYPTGWTDHPQEPWTARKTLRRFLEHEQEHIAQVRQILTARCRHLLARLAAERAGLLEQLLGLDERALAEVPVSGDWTSQDLLAHIAAWDRWEHRTMRSMVAGEIPDFSALQDFDASNSAFVAGWRERTARLSAGEALGEVLAELRTARADWVAWLKSLPLEEFFQPRSYAGHDWTFASVPLQIQWQHDADHARQLAVWREAEGLGKKIGAQALLLAALAAAREELLAAAALVPAEERLTRLVEGEWTLKDVLGHIADWEQFGAEGLRLMAAGQPPQVEHVADIDAWNQVHAQARRDQPWEIVWDDLFAARRALLDTLKRMGQTALAQVYPFPWGPRGTPYQWVQVFVSHDREHARELRAQGEES